MSLLAVFFIASQIPFDLFQEVFISADYRYVIPAMVFLLLGLVTRALRWQALLSGQLPLLRTFSTMNVAYLVNGILPMRIGELTRIYLASRGERSVPAFHATSTIIVERLLDLLAVVAMVALVLLTGNVPEELRLAGVMAALAAGTGLIVLVLVGRRRDIIEKLVSAMVARIHFLERLDIETRLGHFLDGLMPIARGKTLLQAILWTVISWILSIIAGNILMLAFYEQGDWLATMLYIAAAAFAIAVPAVPGNIGTYEASILLALSAMGYAESATAVAFAVMVHAVNLFVHAVTGGLGFIQEGISLEQLSHGVQQMQHEMVLHDDDADLTEFA